MNRLIVLVTLIFALLWQSLAFARAVGPALAAGDWQHAQLHLQEKHHHHHDDGSYHLDDSSESVQHVMADQLHTTAIPSPTWPQRNLLQQDGRFTGYDQALPIGPTLAGPFKPPRTHN